MAKRYYKQVQQDKGNKQSPSEAELHELFGRLAELVDTVATSRHIEAMEAYNIIDRIINYYQS